MARFSPPNHARKNEMRVTRDEQVNMVGHYHITADCYIVG